MQIKKKSFSRLVRKDYDLRDGWFSLTSHFEPDLVQRRKLYGQWCRIQAEKTVVYRILSFDPSLPAGLEEKDAEIVIDWSAWLKLSDFPQKVPSVLELSISKVHWWQMPLVAQTHPDPNYRLAANLGWVSVVLGMVSVVFAIWQGA